MRSAEVGTTDPSLLRRVGDWQDHPAWSEFYRRYDPLLRQWCRRFRLDADQSEEFCQQIWVELSRRLESFHFDPGGRFRGWLWTLFHYRVLDRMKRNRTDPSRPLDEVSLEALSIDDGSEAGESDSDDVRNADRLAVLSMAEKAQETVRAKVHPDTWRAFWLVAIEGMTVREVADQMGMKYAAVYVAHRRVAQKLRDEGQRLRADFEAHS